MCCWPRPPSGTPTTTPTACISPAARRARSPPGTAYRDWCSRTCHRGTTCPRWWRRPPRCSTASSPRPRPARCSRSDGVRPGSHQPGVVDDDGDLHAVGGLELLEEPGHVRLHRGHRQVELGGDLRVAETATYREGDVPLAVGETGEPLLGAAGA